MTVALYVLHPMRMLFGISKSGGIGFTELRQCEQLISQTSAWRALCTAASALRAEMRGDDPMDARKYLHVNSWLRVSILRAAKIGLHNGKRLSVLDLGCGTGLFVHVCRAWGHNALGLDRPLAEMPRTDRAVFEFVNKALDVPVHRATIGDSHAISLPGTFNLITAWSVCFNRHRSDDEWGAAEWALFLARAAMHLTREGSVYLALNPNADRYGALEYYDDATLALFRRCGAFPQRGIVSMTRAGIVAGLGEPTSVLSPPAADPAS